MQMIGLLDKYVAAMKRVVSKESIESIEINALGVAVNIA